MRKDPFPCLPPARAGSSCRRTGFVRRPRGHALALALTAPARPPASRDAAREGPSPRLPGDGPALNWAEPGVLGACNAGFVPAVYVSTGLLADALRFGVSTGRRLQSPCWGGESRACTRSRGRLENPPAREPARWRRSLKAGKGKPRLERKRPEAWKTGEPSGRRAGQFSGTVRRASGYRRSWRGRGTV
jgi:hypothetical protein